MLSKTVLILLASTLSMAAVQAAERSNPGKAESLAALKAAARSGAALNPNALGSLTSDLVYTPVTPCRIVDTRNALGAFAGGQTRNFDFDGLSGAASTYAQQGGIAASCNVPFGRATAAALNITVTGTGAAGYLTAWGLGTQPNASVLNWAAGETTANTTIVPVVPGNGADFSIYSSTGTQVIIDVVGYFAAPTAIQTGAPIRMGSETGTAEAPTSGFGGTYGNSSYSGLVTRRIVSTNATAGSIIARTSEMTLERDGTAAGFQIRWIPTTSALLNVRGTIVNGNGTVTSVNFQTFNDFAGGLASLFRDADGVVFAHLIFGNINNADNLTEVTMARSQDFWVGTMVTGFNQ